jgi:hypothetical protein
MFAVLSALVASACVLASARRLAWAISPTWLDPRVLAKELGAERAADWPLVRAAILECRDAVWERDLLSAIETRGESARAALVNEQLRELDWRTQRWARAPRVCVRVAASAGFLFGLMALVSGLTSASADAGVALLPALDALTIGVAGASICFAVHRRAGSIVRGRLAATDRLVERLESLAASRLDRASPGDATR